MENPYRQEIRSRQALPSPDPQPAHMSTHMAAALAYQVGPRKQDQVHPGFSTWFIIIVVVIIFFFSIIIIIIIIIVITVAIYMRIIMTIVVVNKSNSSMFTAANGQSHNLVVDLVAADGQSSRASSRRGHRHPPPLALYRDARKLSGELSVRFSVQGFGSLGLGLDFVSLWSVA